MNMDRRTLYALLVVLVVAVVVPMTLSSFGTGTSEKVDANQQYPAGAGPAHINFSALSKDSNNLTHAPREYWDSYAISYTEPPDRWRVEGEYYINSTTGEIIAERWDDGTVYRNSSAYAYVQPASGLSTEYERQDLEDNPGFVYDQDTDAFYKYRPHNGFLSPTNIGRHPEILKYYSWEATETTTHHGVPVITYELSSSESSHPNVPPAVNGSLQLGADDGVIYAFDITLDDDESEFRYTYSVHPVEFPNHEWVKTAQEVVAANSTSTSERLAPTQVP